MDVRRGCAALVGVVGLALPASALGQQTIAPPGKSGADQYFETIPSAKGNVAPPSSPGSTNGPGAVGLRALAGLGKDGQTAAAVASGTNPVPTSRQSGRSDRGDNGRSPLSSVTNLLGGSDSGGIGLWLPILLAALLTSAIIAALIKLRRRDEPV